MHSYVLLALFNREYPCVSATQPLTARVAHAARARRDCAACNRGDGDEGTRPAAAHTGTRCEKVHVRHSCENSINKYDQDCSRNQRTMLPSLYDTHSVTSQLTPAGFSERVE